MSAPMYIPQLGNLAQQVQAQNRYAPTNARPGWGSPNLAALQQQQQAAALQARQMLAQRQVQGALGAMGGAGIAPQPFMHPQLDRGLIQSQLQALGAGQLRQPPAFGPQAQIRGALGAMGGGAPMAGYSALAPQGMPQAGGGRRKRWRRQQRMGGMGQQWQNPNQMGGQAQVAPPLLAPLGLAGLGAY